ncbi:unnamed protein product, partial [marine sediment metagenome]
MNRINIRFNKYITSKCIGVAICVLLVATSLTVAFDATSEVNPKDDHLSYSFEFIEPGLQMATVDATDYTLIQMSGCMAIGKQAGGPMLPVKSVKLMLPAMTTVTGINVIGNPIELTNIKTPVYP